MENRIKLKYCVIFNIALFAVILICVILFRDSNNKYLTYGPNSELVVMSVKIDTVAKYLWLQAFLFVVECSRVFINEIASPILGFNIYNPDKKVITEFSKYELQLFANTMWFINSLISTLFVMITISQIDIALLRVLYSELTTIVTIRILLNEKTFVDKGDYECLKESELEPLNILV
jgi:hypothetical protein